MAVLRHPAAFSDPPPPLDDPNYRWPEPDLEHDPQEGEHDPQEGEHLEDVAVTAEPESKEAVEPSAQSPSPSAQSPSQSQTEWSDRHHVTWCNERHTSGSGELNPVPLRSYFDRSREPHHSRCEVPVKAQRVLPAWKLRTDPLTGNDISGSTMSSSSRVSTAVDILKAPTRALCSRGNSSRENRWNARHELVFKNEEVSRLDRNYFDRWKEPEANLHAERVVRSFRPTWALTREGSPEKTAQILLSASALRHTAHGTWNERHQRMFSNDIHANLKSYFDRRREAEDYAASRRRKKLKDKDKLRIEWSLSEYPSKVDFSTSLRTESAPALLDCDTSKKKKKTAPTWFSSHGILF